MVKQKEKVCVECGESKLIFSKGRCKMCASKSYGKIKVKPKIKENKAELDEFFTKQVSILQQSPYSTETKTYISNPSRLNIAHIFPKRNHKSVETEDTNVAYLTWQEHSDFDSYLDKHQFEKIEKNFPKVWILLQKVLPLVQERTKLTESIKEYLL